MVILIYCVYYVYYACLIFISMLIVITVNIDIILE